MENDMFRDELFNMQPQQTEDAMPESVAAQPVPAAEETATEGQQPDLENTDTQLPNAPQNAQPSATASEQKFQIDPVQLIEALVKLQNENNQLKGTIQQQSQSNEEAIVQQLQPPTLDYDKLMYADDETRKSVESEYVGKLGDYIRSTTLKDMEPMLEEYRMTKESRDYTNAINELKALPDVGQKFGGSLDGAMGVINQIPALKQLKAHEAVITAALIAKGKESLNSGKRTPEQIANEAMSNPDVMKLLEMRRIEAAKTAPVIPAMAASHGALDTAPLNLPKKPTSFDEAFEELNKIMK